MSPSLQKILIGFLTLVLFGAFGYYDLFIKKTDIPASADLSGTVVVGQDILDLVDKLNMISIDSSLFSGALVSNLKDFSATLLPEQEGRFNPFLPVGIENGQAPAVPYSVKTDNTTTASTTKTSAL